MIVQERENEFLMIKQHDHAQISGQMVLEWKKNFLLRSKLREEADWAIAQHDRAWIPLDEHPKWNDEKNRPYTFIDYPIKEKIEAYQRGIKEVAERSLYAGMLCSMHYMSFFSEDSDDPAILQFIGEEKKRQEDLFKAMKMDVPKDIYHLHFKRLQFCDDLSLYVCMQEPGIPKEQEVPWFKDGFRQTFDFAPDGIMANWVDQTQVSVNSFPFSRPFEVHIPYRSVSKKAIEEKGLEKAYHEAETAQRTVKIISEE
ncbi:DUF3891 family protein [Halobacillus mangrovi]|uniref:DUF3891 family protein n=1 Tax=Halobacillus mangrovi TaxID=402384 RepID=UPI003D9597AB